jgi:low temperature requirement protein LtrA
MEDVATYPAGMADPPAEDKRVSSAELFFDLVFVIGVTEVSRRLHTDHRGLGVLRALLAFVPFYWVWVGTAIRTNLQDTSRPALRLQVFAIAMSGMFMALGIETAFEGRGLLFALAYWSGRCVLGVPVLWQRRSWTPYTLSMVVTGPLLTLGALFDAHVQLALWSVAAILDLLAPSMMRRRLSGMHYDAGHLAERFGLFVLIALGESVVAIGAGARDHLSLGVGFAVVAAFVFSCGLWWVYFHYAADAMRHALATAAVQLDITRLVLSYGHLSFIASIIAIAVGLNVAVAAPRQPLHLSGALFLFGGSALYLATFGFTRWAMFRLVSSTRLTAAAGVLVLLPAAIVAPALVSLSVLAVLLIVLNTVELARVERIGWRARMLSAAE